MYSRVPHLLACSLLLILMVSAGCLRRADNPNSGGPTGNSTPAASSQISQTTNTSIIAFSAPQGVAFVTPDGSVLRQLDAAAQDSGPLWSPDGKQLAYKVSAPRERSGLYILPLATGSPRKIAADVGQLMGYTWSPDGRRIAYNDNSTQDLGLYVVDVGTGANSRITPEKAVPGQPSWSPDGKWIAVQYGNGVNLVSPEGLTSKLIAEGSFVNRPAWSPDGRQLLLVQSSPQGTKDAILLAQADGSGATKIWETKGTSKGDPKWSPDGKRILFFDTDSLEGREYQQLWVANADGQNAQVYLEATFVGNASWAPDSSAIAVGSFKDNARMVHVLSADGKEEMALALGFNPSWSPVLMGVSPQQMGQPMAEPTPSAQAMGAPYLGIYLAQADGDLLARLGQPARDGLLVYGVVQGSPSDLAGLASRDLLTNVNGQPLRANGDLDAIAGRLQPGSKVSVKFLRAGVEKSVEFSAGLRPANDALIWNQSFAQSLKANPKDPFVFYARGLFDSDPNRAVRYYSQALELDGKFASAYFERGNAYLMLEKYDLAKADLQKVGQVTNNSALVRMATQSLSMIPVR